MAWIYIMIAGLLEIVWVIGLKYSHGFTELIPSILTVGIIIFSFFLLSKALHSIPVGTGYAIFTGMGTVGTVAIGAIFWGETINWLKIFFVVLMIVGIIGLKIISNDDHVQQEVK
ncbi:DMT family transporter [Aneurinibacillus uraniidurans]|uniref:DMT family transporter n=1 Tax=Aneurinibacillus uraniidurans TaxID=2966586 RepID=UPI00234B57D4|nr:multidrug efflux SMR transporter [Aneurinibacillus sp. B1]WCN39279.1 multidrug efflux SMR transporter [Aneurinibacillus sp. B1]